MPRAIQMAESRCDGCEAGMDLGLDTWMHYDEEGKPVMTCTANAPFHKARALVCATVIAACMANGVPTIEQPQPERHTFDDCQGSPNPADEGKGCGVD